MKVTVYRLVAKALESKLYLGISAILDHLVVFVSRRNRDVSSSPSYTMLLPTVGGGNIGDQAMFEAFLDNVPGPIVSIVGKRESLEVPGRHSSRVTTVAIPGLTGGVPWGRLRGRFVLCDLLREAKSINVVGADIMDGGYSRRESILRSRVLWMADQLDVPGQVLGFSWNGKSEALTRQYMKIAARSVKFNLRDPRSYERFSQLAYPHVRRVADMAFTLDSSMPNAQLEAWVEKQIGRGRSIALLNTSGLIAGRHDLDADYEQVARRLLAGGYSVIILPHVIRKGDDDLIPARRLLARLSDNDNVRLVDYQLSPGHVVWLSGRADLSITGRMHLAILSFAQGIPAITLATQGKVEGMLEMFGMEHLAVQPKPGAGHIVVSLLDELIPNLESVQRAICSALPEVKNLSLLNYELPNSV